MAAEWPWGAVPGADVTIDTRQHAGKHEHVDRWFAAHGVSTATAKLDFGDYMRVGSNVSVDTKASVEELAANVLSREHDRFRRECERARAAGYRLVILVEGVPGVDGPEGLAAWVRRRCASCRRCGVDWGRTYSCPRHKVTMLKAARLLKALETMRRDHGVEVRWCSRRDTARIICELLGVDHAKRQQRQGGDNDGG